MGVRLEEIITRLKDEGVEAAQREAQTIIDEAQNQAQNIIHEAEEQAKRLRRHAEEDAAQFAESGAESVRHAARDLVILVRKQLELLLKNLLSESVKTTLQGKTLSECIIEFIKNFNPQDSLSVSIPADQAQLVLTALRQKLQSRLNDESLEIKPFDGIEAGFSVSLNAGEVTFDCSDEELTNLLIQLLSPRFVELLK